MMKVILILPGITFRIDKPPAHASFVLDHYFIHMRPYVILLRPRCADDDYFTRNTRALAHHGRHEACRP